MKIYFDNAATTPIDERVVEEMISIMKTVYGNPSSTHFYGREAKSLIENARKKIAKYTNTTAGEIIFTSCGTEANNLIIRSCVECLGIEHIITSPLEHKCVAETTKSICQNKNVNVSLVKILPDGEIDFEHLEHLLRSTEKKTLITLMHANNEVGNIYDIRRIGTLAKKYNALYHSDMVQTLGHFPIALSEYPVDFASSSAHKYYGPKGVGFAYIKKGTGLKAQITGGGQERNLRSGTENIIGIVGLGKAFEIANENFETEKTYIQKLKNYAISALKTNFPEIIFNGKSADENQSLYTLLSISLPFKDTLIGFELDLKGIAVSQGSACSSGAVKTSPVLAALQDEQTLNATTPLRISFSRYNTKEEIDYLVASLKEIEEKAAKRDVIS